MTKTLRFSAPMYMPDTRSPDYHKLEVRPNEEDITEVEVDDNATVRDVVYALSRETQTPLLNLCVKKQV